MPLENRIQERNYSRLEWLPFIGPVISMARIFSGKETLADSPKYATLHSVYLLAQVATIFVAQSYLLKNSFTELEQTEPINR